MKIDEFIRFVLSATVDRRRNHGPRNWQRFRNARKIILMPASRKSLRSRHWVKLELGLWQMSRWAFRFVSPISNWQKFWCSNYYTAWKFSNVAVSVFVHFCTFPNDIRKGNWNASSAFIENLCSFGKLASIMTCTFDVQASFYRY